MRQEQRRLKRPVRLGFCQAVTADAMAAIGTAIGVETCSAAEQAENHSDGECVWVNVGVSSKTMSW